MEKITIPKIINQKKIDLITKEVELTKSRVYKAAEIINQVCFYNTQDTNLYRLYLKKNKWLMHKKYNKYF